MDNKALWNLKIYLRSRRADESARRSSIAISQLHSSANNEKRKKYLNLVNERCFRQTGDTIHYCRSAVLYKDNVIPKIGAQNLLRTALWETICIWLSHQRQASRPPYQEQDNSTFKFHCRTEASHSFQLCHIMSEVALFVNNVIV